MPMTPNPGDMYKAPNNVPVGVVLRADKASALLLVGDGSHGTPTTYLPYTELTGTFRPATVAELHRGARAIFHFLGMRPGGYVTGYDRDLFDLAGALLYIADASLGGCPHGDRFCPCQDGDACHYEGEEPAPCPRTRAVGCDCRTRRAA